MASLQSLFIHIAAAPETASHQPPEEPEEEDTGLVPPDNDPPQTMGSGQEV